MNGDNTSCVTTIKTVNKFLLTINGLNIENTLKMVKSC